MTKNVTVTDESGNYIGSTYPRRAKGLVKNGRALFVDDCTIRLSAKVEPSDTISSEVNQMNYIFLNPRNWTFQETDYQRQNGWSREPFTQKFHAIRSYISDFDGTLTEGLLLGDWDTAYVRAFSRTALLPETDYCFVFWLNGGENDKGNGSEVCELRITFGNDANPANAYIYKLNRNYIKPLLHKQGWELYSIPFCTPASTDSVSPDVTAMIPVELSFISGYAPMAVKEAKEPEFYKDWTDEPDEFAEQRLQRHNLVFADGFPARYQYGGDKFSTEVLRSRKEHNTSVHETRETHGRSPDAAMLYDTVSDAVDGLSDVVDLISDQLTKPSTNSETAEAISSVNVFIKEIEELIDKFEELMNDIERAEED